MKRYILLAILIFLATWAVCDWVFRKPILIMREPFYEGRYEDGAGFIETWIGKGILEKRVIVK